MKTDPYIHESADVSPRATIGPGTRIWHQVHIREGAQLGQSCIVGKGAYIDTDVVVGDKVKIQNGALLYHGATIEGGVFIGPGAMLLNDRYPRAITPDGELKGDSDWKVSPTHIEYGASIGGGATVLPGIRIGRFALVAAGSLVTRNVKAFSLVAGSPAEHRRWVCRCGVPLPKTEGACSCAECGRRFQTSTDAIAELAQ